MVICKFLLFGQDVVYSPIDVLSLELPDLKQSPTVFIMLN